MNAIVQINDGRAMTTSKIVAASFEKRHTDVLRDIRNLIKLEPILGERNFASFKTNDLTGETTSHYEIDRDGFTLLAMGFTGSKALKWKLKYIAAFNAMEAALLNRRPKLIDKPFVPVLQEIELVNAHVGLVAEVRRNFGRTAARRAYQMTALPQLERSDPDFYPEPCVSAEDDSDWALRHLLQQAAGNGGTLGSLIRLAFSDEVAAKSLEKMGIRIIQDSKNPRFAVSEKHDVLANIFAETPWEADWSTTLNGLDRSFIRLTMIGGKQVRAVHIPKAVLP